MIAGAAIAMSAIILGLGWIVLTERHRPATTGREGMIGEVGEVREAIAPGAPGRVFVHGEHLARGKHPGAGRRHARTRHRSARAGDRGARRIVTRLFLNLCKAAGDGVRRYEKGDLWDRQSE